MEQIRDICSGENCGRLALIVNKHFYLCEECNYKRLHQGQTKQEVYRERAEQREKKIQPITVKVPSKEALVEGLRKTFSIKKISNKRAEREKELKLVYKEIDSEREQKCQGCNRYDRPLSHSHLLSRANRPDLMCVKENIALHCFGEFGGPNKTCHEKWSDMDPEEVVSMKDFKENIAYVKSVDMGVYNRIVAKFEFVGVKI